MQLISDWIHINMLPPIWFQRIIVRFLKLLKPAGGISKLLRILGNGGAY